MNKSTMAMALAGSLLFCGVRAPAQESPQLFREAVELYERGAYGRARTLFEQMGDPFSEAWSILCAVKQNSTNYAELIKAYESKNPTCVLAPQIHYAAALNLFDEKDYAAAARELAATDIDALPESERGEYVFKKGYCAYRIGNYPDAVSAFVKVNGMPYSVYTAPARYTLGYIAYSSGDFATAAGWFEMSREDSRFSALSNYYVLECRFMDKDYGYVTSRGPEMLSSVPAERKTRLARIISESFLVRGDRQKALEYFELEDGAIEKRSRTDLFHAGSVYYAVQDYPRAIHNFSLMKMRTDSIGQVANYEMAYAYIQTGNKVAAEGAFREAAASGFDQTIAEDAFFNAAKLAFDLNGDTSPFKDYIDRYPRTGRKEQIYNYMAIAALNSRDYAGAIENYSRIEELDNDQKGNYVKANFLRGSQLVSGGAWSDAIPYLKAAGFYYPRTDRFNQLSRYWLGEAYFGSGNFSEAEKVWTDLYNTSALRGMRESAILPYNLGYAYYNERKYEQAARWLDIYSASGDPLYREDALTRRADCEFARHNYGRAAGAYERVLNEYPDPDNIYPFYQQAISYGLAGNKKSKISSLLRVQKASSGAPLYSEAMYELGRAYMEDGSNEKAVEIFERLSSTTADNTFAARALIGKGMAWRNMKKYDNALEQYRKVVELMPGSEYSEEALLAINSIYQTTGQPEKYIEFVESSGLTVGKTPEERENIYFNTAEQVYLAGNYTQAVQSLQKYLDDYPDGARRGDACFYLADSYRQIGNKEKACECYASVPSYLKEGPFAEGAALGYASLSFELERFADAYAGWSYLQQIAKMPENIAAARLGKMRSAFQAREWADAVAAADEVRNAGGSGGEQIREADFIKARALLASSRRAEAFEIFAALAKSPSTDEGAESTYMLVQDMYDSGRFDEVENRVYDFAGKAGGQNYWLARCYIVLSDTFAAKGNAAQAKATLESIRDGYTPAAGGDDILETVNSKLN